MSNPQQDAIVPAAAFSAKHKHLYNESQNMYHHGIQAGWIEKLLKCAALYNIKEHSLHLIDKLSYADYLQKIGITDRHARRYIHIAERMKEMCLKTLKSAGSAEPEEDFVFNQRIIKDTFGKFFENGGSVGILQLAEKTRSLSEFENFLSGNAELSEKEVTKLLSSPKQKADELPAATASVQDTLFSMHEKIIAAGYLFDKVTKRYMNSDGSLMTTEQLGEFVDEDAGMKVFHSVKFILQDTADKTLELINNYAIFFQAYSKRNPSPAAKQKCQAEFNDVLMHIKKISGLASTIWGD